MNVQRYISTPCKRRGKRGVALLLVLFAIMFLGFLITGLWESVQYSWDESGLDRKRFEALLLAESGIEIAMHPDVSAGDEVLRRDYGDGRAFLTFIRSEGSRFLINSIVEEPVANGIRELFILWGLDATEASTAVESMIDWIDEDDDVQTTGAENGFYSTQGYEQFPLNVAFTSLEQMLLVRGMERVAQVKPDWRDFFTLYGIGTIDVNQADAQVLEAFFGSTREAALNVVATRNGTDGIPGTDDDEFFDEIEDAQALLGVSDEAFEELSTWATTANSVLRIQSEGIVGDFSLRLVVLIDTTDDQEDSVVLARMEER
jgi:general secretion pathway protein K